ncbi:hypothetical protein [Aquamicrobium soli]|uniref:Uncharacterized protein n=1 Tax=Aquamicrobium soli TaxID=1811518 RepID=A0ABV7KAN7_9HYPH
MKAVAIIAASLATLTAAHADERLDSRVELMKLAYVCDGAGGITYKTARDSALRAEQMATVGAPDKIVLGVDRGLRDGTIKSQVDKAKCADLIGQMTFEMKAKGF